MKNKKCSGFSLIEMIVAITIVLILTGIGISNFSNLSKNKNLMSAKGELVSWLTNARNLAMTGQLPDKSLNLNFVKVTVSNVGLTAVGISNNSESQIFSNNVFSNRDNLIVLMRDTSGPVTSFGFSRGGGRLVDQSGNFVSGLITITLNNGETSIVTVNDLGIINEK